MLGHQLDDKMLAEIINEVDADGSGELEFEEFVQLAARFMVEEDAEVFFCALFQLPRTHPSFISSGHATRT
jgi:Ca2+-binding EF-hand superfamily protein